MIAGEINLDYEAIVRLRVRGQDGTELELSAILDTGFSDFLTLSTQEIMALVLERRGSELIRLGDGSRRLVLTYRCRVWWNEQWREIVVQESDGDPLIGMALLRDHLVTLDVVTGGSVLIEERD